MGPARQGPDHHRTQAAARQGLLEERRGSRGGGGGACLGPDRRLAGIDGLKGVIVDMKEYGITEPFVVKAQPTPPPFTVVGERFFSTPPPAEEPISASVSWWNLRAVP